MEREKKTHTYKNDKTASEAQKLQNKTNGTKFILLQGPQDASQFTSNFLQINLHIDQSILIQDNRATKTFIYRHLFFLLIIDATKK